MTPALELLYASQDLSSEQTEELFTKIFNGETDPAVFASILTALKMKGEAPSEIAGAARAMVRAARHFPRPEGIEIGEIVGTGGDGKQSINVSTIAALGAASNGLFIAKHGNRSVSSKTGASDLLRTGFAFCFAQLYHTSMKNVMPVRSALATRTIFNILGPLTNPSHPDYAVIGVYDTALIKPVAQTLKELGMKRGFVVHGSGYDEVSVSGPSEYARLYENGDIQTGRFTPADFGITAKYTEEDVKGGLPEENARIAQAVLSGRGKPAHNDMVCANMALLLLAGNRVQSIAEGVELARQTLATGRALGIVEAHRDFARNGTLAQAA